MEVDTAEEWVLDFHFWFMAFVPRFLDKAYHKTVEWNKLQRVAWLDRLVDVQQLHLWFSSAYIQCVWKQREKLLPCWRALGQVKTVTFGLQKRCCFSSHLDAETNLKGYDRGIQSKVVQKYRFHISTFHFKLKTVCYTPGRSVVVLKCIYCFTLEAESCFSSSLCMISTLQNTKSMSFRKIQSQYS